MPKILTKIKKFFEKEDLPKKVKITIIVLIEFLLAIALVRTIIIQEWTIAFVTALTLILVLLPSLIERKYNIDLPEELEIMAVVFIYATLFLGEVNGYYTKFWWWDLVLHGGSAVGLGFIGFLFAYVLHERNKINAEPIVIGIFSFCFAMAIGAIWEIFEFSMDQIFGFMMQKSSIDTMSDLIVDAVGASIASLIGIIYLKSPKFPIVHTIIKRFKKNNKKILKKVK